MGIFIKASKDKPYVWLVWVIQNFDYEGRRVLHSVHTTRKGAIKEEGTLVRDEIQYYIIQKKELTE